MTDNTEEKDPPGLRLVDNIEKVIIGKRKLLNRLAAALFAGGHVLIEDVPGTGKTMLARTLARSLSATFRRIQFTPDLLPADLTGVSVLNPKTTEFEFREGPLFSNIVLADELNRATPRTQSALLEAMGEGSISVDGITHELPELFFVLATQNPVEQHGVYQLPEAQLDRFMIRVSLGYTTQREERDILEAQRVRHPAEEVESVVEPEEILEERRQLREEIQVEANVSDYIIRIISATREHRDILLGASARASIALYRMSQALAWLQDKAFVTPNHVKELAPLVICHRLILKPQARLGGVTPEQIVEEILANVEVPVTRMREG